MNLKKLKILAIVIAFGFCFPLHFLYERFPNFITSILSPVNESIWEHMKILFGSILLAGIVQKIIILFKKVKVNNVCFSNFVAAVGSIPIFLIIYLPIYYIFGSKMVINILVMLVAIILAEVISFVIMNKRDFKMENITIFFVILIYIVFGILTYYPLKIDIFIDPTNSIFGIAK